MQVYKPKEQCDDITFDALKSLFYPQYPPGINDEEFLTYYQPLFQELRKLDIATQQQLRKLEIICKNSSLPITDKIDYLQKITFFIIYQLNNLCTHCHRKQLRIKINAQLIKYKNNLQNIPIGKHKVIISYWQEAFYKNLNFQQLEISKKQQIITILDKLYVEHKIIPNYYKLFLGLPDVLINIYNFEQKVIFDSKEEKTSMPLSHKYFLGVIAASTYGCRYLWNLMVKNFLKYGGDLKWIEVGLDEIPQYLKKFSQISYQFAYHFKMNILEDICFQMGKLIEDASILQGFYILAYFQFLSCLSLVFGLTPQSTEYQKYLPQIPYIKPSLQSFQTMKKASKKEFKYQNQIAKQFQQMYSWDKDSDKQNFKRVQLQILEKKTSQSKKFIDRQANSYLTKSNPSTQSTKQITQSIQNELMVTLQEQLIIKKIKASSTMKNIEDIYGKFVQFDKRRSLVQFQRKTPKKVKSHNHIQRVNSQQSKSSDSQETQYDFIYASQWNFQDNAGNLMDSVISPSFHAIVFELLKCIKFLDKEKSKNLKMYYESLQNYMYEYVSYVNLINENLSLVQKNYVKLLTRSPFLFNQKSFIKMKEDLQSVCKICKPFRFALEIFSFKLEHSLSLASYSYYRYLENK